MSLFGISTIMLELKHISWPEIPLVYMSISDKKKYIIICLGYLQI
jgi:hypothetical protein